METLREYEVSEILELVTPSYREIVLLGYCVKIGTLKLQTFKRDAQCVCCGKRGNVFRLETFQKQPLDKIQWAHFNLYHITQNNEILMSMDHIIPLSKKGPHRLFNTQTMCITCNRDKCNKIELRYFSPKLKTWARQREIFKEARE